MTDKEIIKALECCVNWGSTTSCADCPLCNTGCVHFSKLKETLDLINRQQEEIERLQNEIGSLNKKYPCTVRLGERCLMYARSLDDYDKQIGDISSEAVKEFAERLKEHWIFKGGVVPCTEIHEIVDNLVKEMVGEQNEYIETTIKT